ncbi:MAG: hypothetical protein CL662_10710 [Bacteroidetes bacterium]|jgi:hypothetical protein|nr:hypothetical protein [Bacteroidota bacterium]|tara:strand:+ start:801 stop:1055 length:255 start_codon:yes stop_codon:yes gene_type:complete
MFLKKDLLCLLLQQEEDVLIRIRINSGIPLLIQGGANYSEPKNLFISRGGPFPSQSFGSRLNPGINPLLAHALALNSYINKQEL